MCLRSITPYPISTTSYFPSIPVEYVRKHFLFEDDEECDEFLQAVGAVIEDAKVHDPAAPPDAPPTMAPAIMTRKCKIKQVPRIRQPEAMK